MSSWKQRKPHILPSIRKSKRHSSSKSPSRHVTSSAIDTPRSNRSKTESTSTHRIKKLEISDTSLFAELVKVKRKRDESLKGNREKSINSGAEHSKVPATNKNKITAIDKGKY